MAKSLLAGVLGRFTSRLRFPQLFTIAALLFVVDLIVPDLIPFVDEILLGLLATLLGMLEKPAAAPAASAEGKPPMKDVTPRE